MSSNTVENTVNGFTRTVGKRRVEENKKMTKESNDDVDCLICYAKINSNSITKHLQRQHKDTVKWNMILDKQCEGLCWLKQHTECETEKTCTGELQLLKDREELIKELKNLLVAIEDTLEKQTEKCKKKLLKLKKRLKMTPKKSTPVKRKADTPTRRTSRKQIQTGSGFYIRS